MIRTSQKIHWPKSITQRRKSAMSSRWWKLTEQKVFAITQSSLGKEPICLTLKLSGKTWIMRNTKINNGHLAKIQNKKESRFVMLVVITAVNNESAKNALGWKSSDKKCLSGVKHGICWTKGQERRRSNRENKFKNWNYIILWRYPWKKTNRDLLEN